MVRGKKAAGTASRGRKAAGTASGMLRGIHAVHLSETNPFEEIAIQTSLLEVQNFEVKPVTALSYPVNLIEFICRPQNYYLDLSNVVLKLKFRILKEDDKDLDANDTLNGLVNNCPASFISRLEVFMNEKPVQMCCDHYPLRSLFETVLNCDEQTGKTKYKTNVWALDTPGEMQTATDANLGWRDRRKAFHKSTGGMEVTAMHRLHLDISSARNLFIDKLTLRIRITLHDPSFFMFNHTTPPTTTGGERGPPNKTRLKVTDASLILKTCTILPDIVNANEYRLAYENARYRIDRVDIRTDVTPSSGNRISLSNIILGSMPNFIAISLLHMDAYKGSYGRNPFELIHNKVSSVSVYINNSSVVLGPVDPDNETGYIPFYHQLCSSLRQNGNDNNMITYEHFVKGTFICAFDISPDQDATSHSHISLAMTGSMRIEIDLKQPLASNLLAVVYAVFPGCLELNQDRIVMIE